MPPTIREFGQAIQDWAVAVFSLGSPETREALVAWAQIIGALGTMAAVIVSLHLARRQHAPKVRLTLGERMQVVQDPLKVTTFLSIRVRNIGLADVTIYDASLGVPLGKGRHQSTMFRPIDNVTAPTATPAGPSAPFPATIRAGQSLVVDLPLDVWFWQLWQQSRQKSRFRRPWIKVNASLRSGVQTTYLTRKELTMVDCLKPRHENQIRMSELFAAAQIGPPAPPPTRTRRGNDCVCVASAKP